MHESPEPILRPVTVSDLDLAYRIKKAAFKHHVDQVWGWDEDYQQQRHAQDFRPSTTRIITYLGTDVGWFDLRKHWRGLFLAAIYILPEYQCKGIGSSILQQLLLEARTKKVPLALGVLKVNTRARKLYEKFGFQVESETDTHYMMKASPHSTTSKP